MSQTKPFGVQFVSNEPLPKVTPTYDEALQSTDDSELARIFADDNTLTFTPGSDNSFDD